MSSSTLYAVYILASRSRGTLYVGSTSNLTARIWQHRNHVVSGFSHSYDVTRLVWFEFHEDFEMAVSWKSVSSAGAAIGSLR
jgi:putative endonuclease